MSIFCSCKQVVVYQVFMIYACQHFLHKGITYLQISKTKMLLILFNVMKIYRITSVSKVKTNIISKYYRSQSGSDSVCRILQIGRYCFYPKPNNTFDVTLVDNFLYEIELVDTEKAITHRDQRTNSQNYH